MPHLIVVSGPNASGKSTLIYSYKKELKEEGYELIIPDDIISNSESPISDAFAALTPYGKNIIFESPLQFPELTEHIARCVEQGYTITLLQLCLENSDNSIGRVVQRKKRGGRDIFIKDVKDNYEGNIQNIIKYYYLFDAAFFMDASITIPTIIAELNKQVLVYYQPTKSNCIKEMLRSILLGKPGGIKYTDIVKPNVLYGRLSFKKTSRIIKLFAK